MHWICYPFPFIAMYCLCNNVYKFFQGASQDNVSPVQIVLPEFLTAANLDSVMEEGLYIVLLFNFFESFAILTFCNF